MKCDESRILKGDNVRGFRILEWFLWSAERGVL